MELLAPYMSYIITVSIALAVLLVGLLVYRLLSGPVMGRKGQRLGISEYHEIDKTRRLVLVRRDETEHLILIGGGQDIDRFLTKVSRLAEILTVVRSGAMAVARGLPVLAPT